MTKAWKQQRELSLKDMGFLEDPFTPAADPRYLYLSAQHGDVLKKTQNVIESSRGLAVVEGGFGVGKSTIARRLETIYRTAEDENVVVFVHSANYPSEYAALLDICNQLNLIRRKGMTQQFRELESFLVEQSSRDRTVVIILDEAQRMTPDALSMVHTLYNFDINRKLAQVILFGQPELQRIFEQRPEVRNRVYSWFTLHPLSFPDAYELIRFRCKVSGRDKPFISQAAYVEVNRVTNGIPRDIVILCSEIVDEVTRSGRNPGDNIVDDAIVKTAIDTFLEGNRERLPRTEQPTLFS